ncbi:MAG: hypothetical protein KKA67_15915 [Spirochaetes bacterium]|nr:hypothetical protein [Spirochaetota bacterium]MBU1082235.1 hypothetical protein [Spirochaetota bacterium]
MRRIHVLFGLLTAVAAGAFCQSNEFIDRLLESDSMTTGQAAYLVLVASDNLGEDADEARAFELLENFGWVPRGATIDAPILIKDYSYLLMKAFGLNGGMLYAMFPGPRYAYRQLVASLVIQGRSDPDMTLSGSFAVRILGRVFDVKGISQ